MTSRRLQGLNDRIRLQAAASAVDAQRIRRGLAFQRLLVRLAPLGLVLKGGYCLEVRLGGLSRTTKDIDLVGGLALAADPDDLLDALEPALVVETVYDGFTFHPGVPRRLRDAGAAEHAWRTTVEARVDGALFERVTLDLVGQVDEVEGATERLEVPPPVAVPGYESVAVDAVDVYQHAAEKLHAYARLYAGGRPSSRVKDLVDLLLLLDAGLLADPGRLRERLVVIWRGRDGSVPPLRLPEPPDAWAPDLGRLLADLDAAPLTLDQASSLVADLYSAALTDEGSSA